MSNHDDIQKKLESFEQETFAKLHVQSGGDEMAAVLDLDQANERTPATFADLVCRTSSIQDRGGARAKSRRFAGRGLLFSIFG